MSIGSINDLPEISDKDLERLHWAGRWLFWRFAAQHRGDVMCEWTASKMVEQEQRREFADRVSDYIMRNGPIEVRKPKPR